MLHCSIPLRCRHFTTFVIWRFVELPVFSFNTAWLVHEYGFPLALHRLFNTKRQRAAASSVATVTLFALSAGFSLPSPLVHTRHRLRAVTWLDYAAHC